MINSIRYTIDGISYIIQKDTIGNWSKYPSAPSVEGRTGVIIEAGVGSELLPVPENDPNYNTYLEIIRKSELSNHIEEYVPEFISQLEQFRYLYGIENLQFNLFDEKVRKVIDDVYITSSSSEAILRYENFLNIKGAGTLEQRKSYLKSLIQKGNKLNEKSINDIVNTITGSSAIVTFFLAGEEENPNEDENLLLVQVLSPDIYKDYRYEDIERALHPLVPAHINLSVVKFFATWEDVYNNLSNWEEVKTMKSWGDLYSYIPPQK